MIIFSKFVIGISSCNRYLTKQHKTAFGDSSEEDASLISEDAGTFSLICKYMGCQWLTYYCSEEATYNTAPAGCYTYNTVADINGVISQHSVI